jgi:hypothetical protein
MSPHNRFSFDDQNEDGKSESSAVTLLIDDLPTDALPCLFDRLLLHSHAQTLFVRMRCRSSGHRPPLDFFDRENK